MKLLVKKLLTHQNIRRFSNSVMDISENVKAALDSKRAVVALETTILTHGMPYPDNITTALAVEDIIRKQGAVPATIGVIQGKIKVGMDEQSLDYLAKPNTEKIKISRRDFPYVLHNKLSGGTTVSGTLVVANMAGIDIFVTGGIGGVHRDSELSMDISADLLDLSRNPTMVVCSGVKSILDIGKTLEYLETLGVCVAAYGNSKTFPAFYCRRSNYECIYNVSTPKDAAGLLHSAKRISTSGILLGVPIPDKFAFSEMEMDAAIQKALEIANKNLLKGKSITPFLLDQIRQITGGKSLESNIELIKNNAKVGSEIALEFENIRSQSALQKSPEVVSEIRKEQETSRPVVIGISMVDFVMKPNQQLQLDGRTQDGYVQQKSGGVARNMIDALGRLSPNLNSLFISVVGDDEAGTFLLNSLKHVDRSGIKIVNGSRSACCSVLLDHVGGCLSVIEDTDVIKHLSPQYISKYKRIIEKSPLVIIDGNISYSGIQCILEICSASNTPVWFEPTDITKAGKPFSGNSKIDAIKYISPNFKELQVIANKLNGSKIQNINEDEWSKIGKEAIKLTRAILSYIPNVIATLGKYGLLVGKADGMKITHYNAPFTDRIINVSGAGDCLASGFIAAMLKNNLDEGQIISAALSVTKQSLESHSTVPSTIISIDNGTV